MVSCRPALSLRGNSNAGRVAYLGLFPYVASALWLMFVIFLLTPMLPKACFQGRCWPLYWLVNVWSVTEAYRCVIQMNFFLISSRVFFDNRILASGVLTDGTFESARLFDTVISRRSGLGPITCYYQPQSSYGRSIYYPRSIQLFSLGNHYRKTFRVQKVSAFFRCTFLIISWSRCKQKLNRQSPMLTVDSTTCFTGDEFALIRWKLRWCGRTIHALIFMIRLVMMSRWHSAQMFSHYRGMQLPLLRGNWQAVPLDPAYNNREEMQSTFRLVRWTFISLGGILHWTSRRYWCDNKLLPQWKKSGRIWKLRNKTTSWYLWAGWWIVRFRSVGKIFDCIYTVSQFSSTWF